MKKIGLLFGSFNPVHHGHLLLATHIREAAGLDEIWLVVSPQNPFKQVSDLADEQHRLNMAESACAQHDFIKVCAIEFELEKPSYTYKTLELLKSLHSDDQFTLIIGGDNVSKFKDWKNVNWILENFEVFIYNRTNYSIAEESLTTKMKVFQLPLFDISSTEIRNRIKNGQTIRYFVPEDVEHYIRFHKLYL